MIVSEKQSLVCLYHQADKTLWDQLQLHLNLVQRQHPEYQWHTIEVQAYERGSTLLQPAHLIVLGISVDFLNELYGQHSGLYATLIALSKSWRGQWDSRIIPVRMRSTNWDSEKELFLCRSVLPHLHPWIAGSPRWRNDACADVALLIEDAIKNRLRIEKIDQARLLEAQGKQEQ
jgi:hypothetical protein